MYDIYVYIYIYMYIYICIYDQWCYGLKRLLSVGLSIPRCVAVAIPKVQTLVSCRPASILLADKSTSNSRNGYKYSYFDSGRIPRR